MNIEEKFDREVWWILQEIKKAYLATPKKQPPETSDYCYTVVKPHGVEIWLDHDDSFQSRRNIIYKLQEREWKLLKVLDETRGDLIGEGTRFILKLPPLFNKKYKLWEAKIRNYDNFKRAILEYDHERDLIKKEPEELEKGRQQFLKDEREERHKREGLKIERVKASGKPPLIYMLDIIIEECIAQSDQERIEIHADQLGIEDDLRVITKRHAFLNGLKDSGCFENIERTPYNWFVFTKPNIEKLKKHYEKQDRLQRVAKNMLEKLKQQEDIKQEIKKELKAELEKQNAPKNKKVGVGYKTKSGVGFLLIDNQEIRIGDENTRQAKLIKSLCKPVFGKAKSIDTIFDNIRLTKDSKDLTLEKEYFGKNRKTEIIRGAFKEIQRKLSQKRQEMIKRKLSKKQTNKIKLKLKIENNNVWIE